MIKADVELSSKQVRDILDDCSTSDLRTLGVSRHPDLDQLAGWVEVLLTGDRHTALAMIGAVFDDEGVRAVWERALLTSHRRAA